MCSPFWPKASIVMLHSSGTLSVAWRFVVVHPLKILWSLTQRKSGDAVIFPVAGVDTRETFRPGETALRPV
jgi:hypothetical protein